MTVILCKITLAHWERITTSGDFVIQTKKTNHSFNGTHFYS